MTKTQFLHHFGPFLDAPNGIQKLRELILQLAVQGKLVAQDPNDEPASELLKRIQAEKARLVAEGKIRKPKPLPPISEEEKPFALPEGWEWVRLSQIGRDWGQKVPDQPFSARWKTQKICSAPPRPEAGRPENAIIAI